MSKKFADVYYIFVDGLLKFYLPTICLLTLTVALIYTLKKTADK